VNFELVAAVPFTMIGGHYEYIFYDCCDIPRSDVRGDYKINADMTGL
jgi:hypothetical protein